MLAILTLLLYNSKAIRRVVRAGRRSTIGNRVNRQSGFEGSNPLLSAKKHCRRRDRQCFVFGDCFMKKEFILIILSFILFVGGFACTFAAIEAQNDYNHAKTEIALAGDYGKAVQKANDSKRFIDSYRQKKSAYSAGATACYLVSVTLLVAALVSALKKKKSKNIRE